MFSSAVTGLVPEPSLKTTWLALGALTLAAEGHTWRPATPSSFTGGKPLECLNGFVQTLSFCLELGYHLVQIHESSHGEFPDTTLSDVHF